MTAMVTTLSGVGPRDGLQVAIESLLEALLSFATWWNAKNAEATPDAALGTATPGGAAPGLIDATPRSPDAAKSWFKRLLPGGWTSPLANWSITDAAAKFLLGEDDLYAGDDDPGIDASSDADTAYDASSALDFSERDGCEEFERAPFGGGGADGQQHRESGEHASALDMAEGDGSRFQARAAFLSGAEHSARGTGFFATADDASLRAGERRGDSEFGAPAVRDAASMTQAHASALCARRRERPRGLICCDPFAAIAKSSIFLPARHLGAVHARENRSPDLDRSARPVRPRGGSRSDGRDHRMRRRACLERPGLRLFRCDVEQTTRTRRDRRP